MSRTNFYISEMEHFLAFLNKLPQAMVKEIERYGIPIVHMATITTISESVGANRIVPTIAIPHPVGNPNLPAEEELALRRRMVKKALEALSTEVSGPTQFE